MRSSQTLHRINAFIYTQLGSLLIMFVIRTTDLLLSIFYSVSHSLKYKVTIQILLLFGLSGSTFCEKKFGDIRPVCIPMLVFVLRQMKLPSVVLYVERNGSLIFCHVHRFSWNSHFHSHLFLFWPRWLEYNIFIYTRLPSRVNVLGFHLTLPIQPSPSFLILPRTELIL